MSGECAGGPVPDDGPQSLACTGHPPPPHPLTTSTSARCVPCLLPIRGIRPALVVSSSGVSRTGRVQGRVQAAPGGVLRYPGASCGLPPCPPREQPSPCPRPRRPVKGHPVRGRCGRSKVTLSTVPGAGRMSPCPRLSQAVKCHPVRTPPRSKRGGSSETIPASKRKEGRGGARQPATLTSPCPKGHPVRPAAPCGRPSLGGGGGPGPHGSPPAPQSRCPGGGCTPRRRRGVATRSPQGRHKVAPWPPPGRWQAGPPVSL